MSKYFWVHLAAQAGMAAAGAAVSTVAGADYTGLGAWAGAAQAAAAIAAELYNGFAGKAGSKAGK